MRTTWLGLSAFALLWSGIALGQNAQCDRDCLRAALLRYMNAVAKNEPNNAGIIVGFRQTENAEVKRVGTGTWQSVTALGEVQRLFMDPVTGQAAYFGLVQEGATPAVASVRVKVVDRQVAEAEWYIGRPGQLGMQGDVGADGANAGPYCRKAATMATKAKRIARRVFERRAAWTSPSLPIGAIRSWTSNSKWSSVWPCFFATQTRSTDAWV
jgi:hypothetical protein